MRIDLHTHSSASDGTEPPADLVRAAAAAGLDVVALTDHDTTAGWAEARGGAAAAARGWCRGTEISCAARRHQRAPAGLPARPRDAELAAEMRARRTTACPRAERIVALLARRRTRSPGSACSTSSRTAPPSAGRTSPTRWWPRGVVADRDEAFADAAARRRPVLRRGTTRRRGAARCGWSAAPAGVPVFAHPRPRRAAASSATRVSTRWPPPGWPGSRSTTATTTPADREQLRALAAELGLLVTGSSDYHGTGKLNRLGEHTTDPAVLRRIEARASGVEVLRS